MHARIQRRQRNQARKLEHARRAIIKDYLRGFEKKQLDPWMIDKTLERSQQLLDDKVKNTERMQKAASANRAASLQAFAMHQLEKNRPFAERLIRLEQRLRKPLRPSMLTRRIITETNEYGKNRYDYERGERKAVRRGREDALRKEKRRNERRKLAERKFRNN